VILSETSPLIRASPKDVFAFFAEMESNYKRWHPDHVLFRWLETPALKEGVRFHFEERIAGKLLKKTVAFTRIEPGSLIDTLLHGSATWRREPGGIGRRPLF
jgi:hypothetical protein